MFFCFFFDTQGDLIIEYVVAMVWEGRRLCVNLAVPATHKDPARMVLNNIIMVRSY